MERCDFCGEMVPDTEGTTMTGCYCIECLRITRAVCLDGIKELQRRAHERRLDKMAKKSKPELPEREE